MDGIDSTCLLAHSVMIESIRLSTLAQSNIYPAKISMWSLVAVAVSVSIKAQHITAYHEAIVHPIRVPDQYSPFHRPGSSLDVRGPERNQRLLSENVGHEWKDDGLDR